MIYEVRDCLSDTVISTNATKQEADELCAIHGGHDACIHVFEIAELKEVKRELKEKIKEQKPLAGMLF